MQNRVLAHANVMAIARVEPMFVVWERRSTAAAAMATTTMPNATRKTTRLRIPLTASEAIQDDGVGASIAVELRVQSLVHERPGTTGGETYHTEMRGNRQRHVAGHHNSPIAWRVVVPRVTKRGAGLSVGVEGLEPSLEAF